MMSRMPDSSGFLDLLYTDAPRADFDALATRLQAESDDPAATRREYDVALRLRDALLRHRARELELSALYETARDLTALRDLDAVLTAIVRRARQLLNADMTYLSLNDAEEGVSYMKVTEGALTPEFADLRLPFGTGLLGLVAETGTPYFTEDYEADARFVHREYIDDAVAIEHIRAILGVPLLVNGEVIGTLLAVHRSVRRFPPEEVSLLMSFAAHASVALENARLFGDLDEAHRAMTRHTAEVEQAAEAHDRLTDVLVRGGDVADVTAALADLLGAPLAVHDPSGVLLAGVATDLDWAPVVPAVVGTGRSVPVDGGWVAVALAGTEHVATLVLHPRERPLTGGERRTLERGALVIALVLLFLRRAAEVEERLGAELLVDLLDGRDWKPARLQRWSRRRGVRLTSPVAVVVAETEGLDRHVATRVAAGVAAAVRGVSGEYRGVLVVAASGEAPLDLGRRLRSAIAEAGGAVTVGCATGDDADPAAGVRAAFTQARSGLSALVSLGRRGEVADTRGLGLARLLLGDNGPAAVSGFLADVLGPVEEWDRARGTSLLDTLEAWFEAGGSPQRAAGVLHVHPNTVAQRLERVGELLGRDWRGPARSLDLQLALRLRRLHA